MPSFYTYTPYQCSEIVDLQSRKHLSSFSSHLKCDTSLRLSPEGRQPPLRRRPPLRRHTSCHSCSIIPRCRPSRRRQPLLPASPAWTSRSSWSAAAVAAPISRRPPRSVSQSPGVGPGAHVLVRNNEYLPCWGQCIWCFRITLSS